MRQARRSHQVGLTSRERKGLAMAVAGGRWPVRCQMDHRAPAAINSVALANSTKSLLKGSDLSQEPLISLYPGDRLA
jgi:hypothetical protein